MGFRIETDEQPDEGLVRVFAEQFGKLKHDLTAVEVGGEEIVRRARVRCKRIRAVLQLARRRMGDKAFRRQNRWWRDAARTLSDVRDLSARVAALDAVSRDAGDAISEAVAARLRAWFDLDRVGREHVEDTSDALEVFGKLVEHAPELRLAREAGDEDFRRSYERAYRAAQGARENAAEGDDPELFHEWRKRVKAVGLQARLLRALYPQLEAHVAAGRALSSVLGHAQDIDVVVDAIRADPSLPVSAAEATELKAVLVVRRDRLFDEALEMARALMPESDVSLEPVSETAWLLGSFGDVT